MDEKYYNTGSVLFIEGDEHIEKLYFIKTGAVQLISDKFHHFPQKILVNPGEFFGHVSCLSGHPRINTAITTEDSVIAEFTKDEFFNAVFNNPEISLKILHGFARQLQIYDNLILTKTMHDQQLSNDQLLYNLGTQFMAQSVKPAAAYVFTQYLKYYNNGMYASEAKSHIAELAATGFIAETRPVNFEFANEQVIFCEYEPADYLYYVKSGNVKIIKNSNDKQITLSILPEGSIFGELGIISDKARNASAISYGGCSLMAISLENFTALVQKSMPIIQKTIYSLSQRLWFTLTRINTKLFDNPITKAYALLENKLLEMRVSLQSTKKVSFQFGLDDLFEMIEASGNQKSNLLDVFTHDDNFSFAFREITVLSPAILSNKSRVYQIRDKFCKSEPVESAEPSLVETPAGAGYQNQYSEVNRSYSGTEKISFRINQNFAPGIYKSIVEDENGKFTRYQGFLKPGEELHFIFDRKGSAKVTVYDKDNWAFKVFLFNADPKEAIGEVLGETLSQPVV